MIKVALGTWMANLAWRTTSGLARMLVDGSGSAGPRADGPDAIRRRALRRQNIGRALALNADLIAGHEIMARLNLEGSLEGESRDGGIPPGGARLKERRRAADTCSEER